MKRPRPLLRIPKQKPAKPKLKLKLNPQSLQSRLGNSHPQSVAPPQSSESAPALSVLHGQPLPPAALPPSLQRR
jgi:hypothetical protein